MENQPFPENVSEWTWETVEGLKESGQSENTYLEYKHRLQYPEGNSDKSEKEWRKDLEREFTAFANSSGGIILFGMNDKIEPSPFDPPKIEASRIVSQLRDNTNPIVSTEVSEPLQPPSEDTNRIALAVRVFEATRKPVATSDSAFYVRINDKKHPMSREQIESLFIEADRRQQAVRQLEIEIDRFHDVVDKEENRFHPSRNYPPDYHLLNVKSLKEVLRENTHLYSDQDVNESIVRVFRILREIEDREMSFNRIMDEQIAMDFNSWEQFYRNERRNLKESVSKLESALELLAEDADLDVQLMEEN